MKVLSVLQPWASLIIDGVVGRDGMRFYKDVENRGWYTSHRGPLLIHASKRRALDEFWAAHDLLRDRFGITATLCTGDYIYGAIIGVVELRDVVYSSASRWFCGSHGFVLAEPRALAMPVPCCGQRGLWEAAAPLEMSNG